MPIKEKTWHIMFPIHTVGLLLMIPRLVIMELDRDRQDNNIKKITEISIHALVLGAASQYLDGFWEANSRNCDGILAGIVTSSNTLPLCYVTWDN